jgi:ribonuclease HII
VHRGRVLHCSGRFEKEARALGYVRVAGVDEVGRGALCGPVVACAVILGEGFDCTGIDDSKRLTERQRDALATRIIASAAAVSLGQADSREIDSINILRATHLAMHRAIAGLPTPADFLLLDGRDVPALKLPHKAIVKGDALSVSIAAASIVAKVERDRQMRRWDLECPGYFLSVNMGYGSEPHRDALRRLGPSQIHRRTFSGTQRWLF